MDHKHIVQIYAHAPGGGGSLGTGYPVAPGRILTAKHVLAAAGATGQIEVRWYNLDGGAREWRPAKRAWLGAEGLDAAILECEFPEGLTAAPYLISCAEPSDRYEWISAGFAAAGGRDAPPTPLRGKVYHLAADLTRTGTFALGVDDAAERSTDWQGVSGCPVFVGQRILGVVVAAQSPFEGRRLGATATCRLLEDAAFREVVGYVEKWKGLQDYRSRLIDVLSGSKEAAERLAVGLNMDARVAWRGIDAFTRAVVDRLLMERLDELLPRLSVAHSELFKKSRASADVLWETACLVMPAVCDVADVQVGRWLERGRGLLSLPAATETLAEIILAAADSREVRFGPRAERPEPLLKIPPPPAGGETAGLSRFEEEWHAYAIQKFVVDPEVKAKVKKPEALIKIAAVELKNRLQYRKERYYYVVDIVNPDEAEEWNKVVARLRQCYPDVVFVALHGEDPDFVREDTLRFHIADMLTRGKPGTP